MDENDKEREVTNLSNSKGHHRIDFYRDYVVFDLETTGISCN
jgi:hypothetical protein